ncbi:hypothetical protein Ade02nite_83730 [Paractinoplanes deccanensis]|uniref:Uncharacterized protein n=1 Tax=Paractinoplanes deccanensis TaxID=113561 RepID=A0ABQ3YIC0_9ACTN|nr:hypothetical protein Ade02nite_83730 [Actinoplanes deccanensis]
MKPPMSSTIEGTAVARIVESIAISAVESMTAARTGPRSDRSPTLLTTLIVYPSPWRGAHPGGGEEGSITPYRCLPCLA